MNPLDDHALAGLFPLIEGEEFAALVADIKAHGLYEPIDLYQGKILDGRNRYRAAVAGGVDLERRNFRTFLPEFYGDPLDYVLAKNLKRRHLNESQRAMVAARLATMRQGERTDLARTAAESADEAPTAVEPSANLRKVEAAKIPQETAARALSISERALQQAKATQRTGSPELVRAVDRGKLAVSAAAKAARLAPEIQRRIAAEAEGDAAGNVVRKVLKQEVRAAREAALGAVQCALPDRRYGVIVADPEWRFEPLSRETGMDRAADNHYPTSPTAEIAARDVGSIAAEDCVLYLWATAPMLPDALEVMKAFGFAYKSHQVWDKEIIGNGYWFRGQHELLLVGTRGNIPAPAMGLQPVSVIRTRRTEHSEKPELFLELIERQFPSLPKIELNRRGPARPGWDAWGNEAIPAPPAPEPTPVASVVVAPIAPVIPARSASDDDLEIPAFLRRTA